MITKEQLIKAGVSQETIEALEAFPSAFEEVDQENKQLKAAIAKATE